MQQRLSDGSVMVCGGCSKDAQLERVGKENKRMCKVGLAVGKRPVQGTDRQETIWCNVVAWHDVAEALASVRKGDPVFVIGQLHSREYQGKTYTDLVAEFVSICGPRQSFSGNIPENSLPPVPKDEFSDLATDDGELPF